MGGRLVYPLSVVAVDDAGDKQALCRRGTEQALVPVAAQAVARVIRKVLEKVLIRHARGREGEGASAKAKVAFLRNEDRFRRLHEDVGHQLNRAGLAVEGD